MAADGAAAFRRNALRPSDAVPPERPLPQPGLPAVPARRRCPVDGARQGQLRQGPGHAQPPEPHAARSSPPGRSASSSRRRSGVAGAANRTCARAGRDQHPRLARRRRRVRRRAAQLRIALRARHVGRCVHRRARALPRSRGAPITEQARYFEEGSVRIHHVHADSLFDFRPRSEYIGAGQRKFQKSALEIVLDVILQGSDEDIERMRDAARRRRPAPRPVRPRARGRRRRERPLPRSHLRRGDRRLHGSEGQDAADGAPHALQPPEPRRLRHADRERDARAPPRRARLRREGARRRGHPRSQRSRALPRRHAATSRTRAASSPPTASRATSRTSRISRTCSRTRRSALQEYTILTEQRSRDVYETVKRSNQFLLAWGATFLVATLALSIASAIWPGSIGWKLPAITAGVSLAQFVGAFFTQPAADLQRNLTNLAAFRMILESHSLKTAFARFHLTTPQMLRELRTRPRGERPRTGRSRRSSGSSR